MLKKFKKGKNKEPLEVRVTILDIKDKNVILQVERRKNNKLYYVTSPLSLRKKDSVNVELDFKVEITDMDWE